MSDEPASRPRVVATCTTTGAMRIETMMALTSVGRDDRYGVSLSIIHDRPYASALNKLAVQMCADESIDWWLHTDNDQAWTANPLDSIEEGRDLIGFPAPIYRPNGGAGTMICLSAWDMVDPDDHLAARPSEPNGKCKRVDVIGSGSFLIRLASLREASIPAPFSREFDVNGVATKGGDVEFCRKWRESGRTIWADFRCLCHHYNTVDLLQVLHDMAEVQRGSVTP